MTDSPVRVSPDPKLDEEEDSEEWRPEAAEKVQTVTVSPPASCRPTAAAYRSVFTSSTAEELARLYNVPPDYNLHAPKAKERAHAPPPGYAAVYAHHFRYGLMLPLQPFVISVLSHYRIALAQLHPNSIITILGFVELCKTASVDPTVSLFRQFFELRRSTMKTEGWYTVYSIPPSIVPRSFKSKEGEWKSAFLFFKTDQITENLRLSWNYSPNLAPPVAKSDRPSEQTVYQLLAKAKGSSKHHEDEEEGKVIVADARMAVVPKTRSSMNGMQAKKSSTVKLDTTATESLSDVCRQESLKRKADFNEAQHAKIPRAPSFEDMTLEQFAAYTQRCYCSSHLQLQGEKEELEKVLEAKERDIKDGENKVASLQAEKEDMEAKVVSLQRDKEELEKDNASLKAEVSRLQRANGGRGPLLKAVEKVVAAMEQDVKDKNEEICFLETQLKSVVHDQSWLGRGVDDKGPLLKVYSQKLSETQASTRLFYDLTALAQRLGRPESAEQVYDHFPAILPGNSQPVIQPFFPGTNDLNVDEDQDSLAAMR